MKIINARWNTKETIKPVPSKIDFVSGILDVEFGVNKIGTDDFDMYKCSIDLHKYAGSAVEIQVQNLDTKKVTFFKMFTNYSYANGNPNKNLDNTSKRIARIFINKDGTDADIQWMTLVEEKEGVIPREEGISHMALAIKHSEYAKEIFEAYKKKSALIGELDHRNSISYLEAQVDALTRYVLSLHNNDSLSPELKVILQAADEQSVLNIKSQEKLVGEMKHKLHVRNEQLKYYSA